MKKILLIIVIMISSFSYYGVVNHNGEKVTDLTNVLDKQNIEVEKDEEKQKNIIVETVEKNDNIEEMKKQTEKNNEQNVNTPKVQEKSNQKSNTTTKQQTKTIQTEKEKTTTKTKIDNTNANTDNNQKQENLKNNTYTETEVQVVEKTECVGNKHKMESGNTGKWFETKEQADNYYNAEIEKWGKQWENGEKTKEEYLKGCPFGYEVWTCPQCQKWTINFYYR